MKLHLSPVTAAGTALHIADELVPRLPLDSWRPYIGLLGVLLGSAMGTLGSRITTFGLADLRGGLSAGFDEGAWITTSFGIGQMLIGGPSRLAVKNRTMPSSSTRRTPNTAPR